MTTPNETTDPEFDTIRALIYEHGPGEAQRIVRRIAKAMDALAALSGGAT